LSLRHRLSRSLNLCARQTLSSHSDLRICSRSLPYRVFCLQYVSEKYRLNYYGQTLKFRIAFCLVHLASDIRTPPTLSPWLMLTCPMLARLPQRRQRLIRRLQKLVQLIPQLRAGRGSKSKRQAATILSSEDAGTNIRQWNAVALWAWDIVVDNCAICRNHIMDLCESPPPRLAQGSR
jgi:hypothetical protein